MAFHVTGFGTSAIFFRHCRENRQKPAGRRWKEVCLKLNRELVETRTELLAWEI
ncbi:hypothetical protein WICANDRAFT_84660 [Wickerhamomyces anomalus NRRL Y-366-8]|uniref:Uncharacterized protein n=1 Tax=Wickerhamomyces anomalus (strain ATCC 58044 / CBS 1984 / NCYC 433 / NRRL Y-366-8) TaxID=683960 RepID=A0A1E3P159_WICAA|nr:uncharacterized protein WICANDRAFT_84660 [Wickerhamomyces anomalus NRRL Y-366-8]ODQ58990.1 hypothetical protein WICANDRAFT_84660 [Wickerhamomyces anomalus NRRL Y-366-8]